MKMTKLRLGIQQVSRVYFPNNQEIFREIKEVNYFWSAYQKFRAKIEQYSAFQLSRPLNSWLGVRSQESGVRS
ncbi:MAG: hypothetical protein AB4080_02250 [Trichodesmium sp.]